MSGLRQRFERVKCFLDYLENEANREVQAFDLARRGGIWAEPFMPKIRSQLEREMQWIDRRIQENAEKTGEDLTWEAEDDSDSEIVPG